MKRVLHVLSTLEQGGTEAVVLNYFANVDRKNIIFDFLVIWGDKKGYYEDSLSAQGCKIFRLQNPPNKFFAHGKELIDFFRREKYDIVHIHSMSSLRYRVAKAAKKCGVNTVIFHSHTSSNDQHLFLHKLLKGRLNKWCDYKFACSDFAGKYMYNRKFDIVNNAIDVDKFSFNEHCRNELRKRYGLQDKLVIGNVGRLCDVKNQDFLIKLVPYLKKYNKNFVIFCVGDGERRALLEALAAENGCSDYIIFAGAVGSKVSEYYSMFDIFAFPSKFEGLSVVLIEAQANGLPIVASDTISSEHKINDNFEYVSIGETDSDYLKWADTIINFSDKRIYHSHAVADSGYDIKQEAKKLGDFYLSH